MSYRRQKNPLEQELRVELDSADDLVILDKTLCGIFMGDRILSNEITTFLRKAVSVTEVQGPYKLLYLIISGEFSIGKQIIYKESFDYDLLAFMLQNGIASAVKRYRKSFESWIASKGLDYSLDSPSKFNEFLDFLFQETVLKYREICEYSPIQAKSYMEQLAEVLKTKAMQKMCLLTASILSESAKVDGEIMQGPSDSILATQKMLSFINDKYAIATSQDRRYVMHQIKSFDDAREHQRETLVTRGGENNFFKELFSCEFGIANVTVQQGEIFAIIGDEGVGKTKELVEQTYHALQNKNDVLMICTETKDVFMQNLIWSRHIFEETQQQISAVELLKLDAMISELPEHSDERLRYEELKAYTDDVIQKMYSDDFGTLTLLQSVKYSDFRSTVEEFIEKAHNPIIAIDSISFLDSDGFKSDKENIDDLMKNMENLANDYGVTFMITTHTSSDANKTLARGKSSVGVRIGAGSGHVTKIATLVLHIHTTEELAEQERFIFSLVKTRDRSVASREVVMQRYGICNHYQYDDSLQASVNNEDNLAGDAMFMETN